MIKVEVSMKNASGKSGRGLARGVFGVVTGSKWLIES